MSGDVVLRLSAAEQADVPVAVHRAREALRADMYAARLQADSARATAKLAAATVGHGADLPALRAEAQAADVEADQCRDAIEILTALLAAWLQRREG